jgi:hypothetical protein
MIVAFELMSQNTMSVHLSQCFKNKSRLYTDFDQANPVSLKINRSKQRSSLQGTGNKDKRVEIVIANPF